MKLIFSFLFLILIHGCTCSGVYAEVWGTGEVFQGIDSKTNYIVNPFAKDNGLKVSCTNATSARGTTNKLYNWASHTIDASAQNGYCEFALKPILGPDDSGNCEFKGVFKGDGTLYRAQILDGSSVVKAQTLPLTNETNWRAFSVNAPCQATPKVRITQTEAGTAPAISVGAYYGPATNIGSGTPPDKFSARVSAGGVLSNVKNGQFIGTVSLSGTSLYNIPFVNLSSPPNCQVTVIKGTDAASIFARKWTAETNSLLQVRTWYSSTATSTTDSPYDFTFSCELTGSDIVQNTITAPNFDYSKPWTNPTTQGFGTPSSVDCTQSRVGPNLHLNCFWSHGTVTSVEARVYLPDGLIVGGTSSNSRLYGRLIRNVSSANQRKEVNVVSKSGQNYIAFSSSDSATAQTPFNYLAADAISASSESISFWAIIPIAGWGPTMNAPQLLGSVTSNAPSALRDEYVVLNLSGASTVSVLRASSNWYTSFTASGSIITATWPANTWSQAPSCSLVCNQSTASAFPLFSSTGVTTTGAVPFCYGIVAAAAVLSSEIHMRCIGPR